ncbi:MAG: tol-pal system protein YbgF [Thioalkalispiraceae bacterium]|jgi:tol-pal system protein YbgF
MNKSLLLFSCLCVLTAGIQTVDARDVQLRSRPGDATSTFGASNSEDTQQLSTEDRLKRLERILDSQGLVDMLVRIENMQSELQILRGEIELQKHELDQIKQRQRDLYVDIDRRLLRIERNDPAIGAGGPDSTGAKAATPKAAVPSPEDKSKTTTAQATTSQPATDFASEQKAYQHAFDLLRDLRYDQAVTAFRKFIATYPNGRYAHIAQYWVGEANYAQRKFKEAIKDYQILIDKYPKSPKLAEALLKIGYSQYELNNFKQAETTLNRLVKDYPGTTEAGQAQNLIQKIRLKRSN